MKEKLDSSYSIYIVKRNEGTSVRLTLFNDAIRLAKKGELHPLKEIHLADYPEEDLANELWKEGSVIWFSPIHPRIWEATEEDEMAKIESQLARGVLYSIPDVTQENMEDGDTLIHLVGKEKKVYKIVDGNWRTSDGLLSFAGSLPLSRR